MVHAEQTRAYEHALAAIRAVTEINPRVGIVLGSGLGELADSVEDAAAIPYEDIPGFPTSTVHGHSGQLVIGWLEGVPVVMQRGRAHFYEGYDLAQVTYPIRVMKRLGVETVILTNAAGGINAEFRVGDVMLLRDHINFVGMAGHNPLIGANDDAFGGRFPSMTRTYDRDLRHAAREQAAALGVPFYEGTYACVAGPNFETPAEIRALRSMGADAVGMSTVHEAIVARHAGMRVLAFSGITNTAIDNPDAEGEPNHEEVLEAGLMIAPRVASIIRAVLRGMVRAT